MPSTHPLTIAGAIVAAGLALAGGLAAMPTPPTLSTETTGGASLISLAGPALAEAGVLDKASVAFIDGDKVRYANFGADAATEYEIGSTTKTMTALLFADAIDRGEVTPGTTLGEILPLQGTPVAALTLEEIASQRSGLPYMPTGPSEQSNILYAALTKGNPYTYDLDQLLDQARTTVIGAPGEFVYSNLGAALLGQAIAQRAGIQYRDLLQERLLTPLGMTRSRVALDDSELDYPTTGFTRYGTSSDPWPLGAYAAAGGVRSTITDMAAYAQALLEERAPGYEAMDPRFPTKFGQIGYIWLTVETGGLKLTMHDGMTGGFSAFIMLDRQNGRASVILSNTAVSVDQIAIDLLTKAAQP